jgi:transcriptional regulator with XRE-family HTH domain
VRYKNNSVYDPEAAVERLREFLRLNYLTGNQVARRIGVRDTTIYSWLQGRSTPRSATAARIIAFLDSLPTERAGIMPTGYDYREYKNWRGILKPRRCPFCKQAKGEIRKVRGAFPGVCPSCGATGPKGEGYDRALLAWNGKDAR